jgi:hypothetical protein
MLVLKAATAKEIGSSFVEETSFHTVYTCGYLKVVCKSIVGFSVQQNLLPISAGISSIILFRYFKTLSVSRL